MKFLCYSAWNQLPDSANALFLQAEKGSLFYSRPWLVNVAHVTTDHNQSMLLACVVDDNKVMAILPLIKCSGNTWYSLKHRYTSLYNLLISDNKQQQVLTCLTEGLYQLPITALLLEPVADSDSRITALQNAMEAAGFNCDSVFRYYNWIYPLQNQSYADYMATRPARLRNTISRKKRKLEREHGYQMRLFTADEVPQAMPDYYAAYTASWKANEQYLDFLNEIVASFSKYGWSRLAILYVNEQPIAAQLWFVLHGKANIFRLAYDKAWKQYSPGTILTSFLMEHVIDVEQVKEIDFLTGNDAYKQEWMSQRRERFALSCVKNIKPISRFHLFITSVKKLLKTP